MILAGEPATIKPQSIDLSTNELAEIMQLSPISTGPHITTFGPIKTLLPILGTFLYGNFLTVEKRKPNTQFSPISVPGISTVPVSYTHLTLPTNSLV